MDDKKEGLLLMGTAMIVLVSFLIALLAVMIIYRKRKVQHIRDIQEMNERAARELLQAQMEVQQQTMQHIGREIHDNVDQKLTLAVLYVQQTESADPEGQSRLESIATIIHESLSDLRSLSKSLTDNRLMEEDLDTLIEEECAKVGATGYCKTVYQADCSHLKASGAVKSFVIRILQEFLHNSLKHSKCSQIRVSIGIQSGNLEIAASDNGIGFQPDSSGIRERGIGLGNMKRRAEMIHASITLESVPGEGSSMRLLIPLPYLNG